MKKNKKVPPAFLAKNKKKKASAPKNKKTTSPKATKTKKKLPVVPPALFPPSAPMQIQGVGTPFPMQGRVR